MVDSDANKSIKCNVKECTNHCGAYDYCTLPCIKIGANTPKPENCECVDCKSFVAKIKCNC